MIEPKFYISEGGFPVFHVDEEYDILWEIGSCKKNYVDKIVFNLDRVASGEQDQYQFGRERYSITCNSNVCTASDEYESEESKTFPFDDIYNLMKAWKEYYEAWERSKSQ